MHVSTVIWLVLAGASAASLAVRRPWTAVLARRRVPEPMWEHPVFHETNMVMTGAWAVLYGLAAVISLVAPAWASAAVGGVFVLLGIVSFKAGERYAAWRLARSSA